MKNTILFIFIAIVIFACGEGNSDKDNNSVSGKITNATEGTQIFLSYISTTSVIPIDTAKIDAEGNYNFTKSIKDLGYYRLKINDNNFINLILNKGETPVINGDVNDLNNTYTVSGSVDSERLQKINLIYKRSNAINDSLNQVFQANQSDPTIVLGLRESALNAANTMNNSLVALVNETPGSLSSLAATDLLDPDKNFELFKKVDEAFLEKMPDSEYFKKFHKKMEDLNKLAIGGLAPEITLADKNGKMTSLSSLKGNVVLIDFWASWCRPCRAENPNVVKAYNKYNKDGFEVFSVSLDGLPQQQNAKQAWTDAIAKDGLIWKSHVSDLKGWNSSSVQLYGFNGIPFTVLVDRDGNIIGKNIRGQALQQKLSQIFGS